MKSWLSLFGRSQVVDRDSPVVPWSKREAPQPVFFSRAQEIRHDVVCSSSPRRRPFPFPVVVVARVAAHVDHAVDRLLPPTHPARRNGNFAVHCRTSSAPCPDFSRPGALCCVTAKYAEPADGSRGLQPGSRLPNLVFDQAIKNSHLTGSAESRLVEHAWSAAKPASPPQPQIKLIRQRPNTFPLNFVALREDLVETSCARGRRQPTTGARLFSRVGRAQRSGRACRLHTPSPGRSPPSFVTWDLANAIF